MRRIASSISYMANYRLKKNEKWTHFNDCSAVLLLSNKDARTRSSGDLDTTGQEDHLDKTRETNICLFLSTYVFSHQVHKAQFSVGGLETDTGVQFMRGLFTVI